MVRRKKKSNIICVMRPIENIEVYKKSLATVMLDILENPKLAFLNIGKKVHIEL